MNSENLTLKPFDADWTISQRFALIEELSNISRLIELGISEVHRLSGSNDFHHGALQLLAQGIERLVKCTVIAAKGARGELPPTKKELSRGWGHRLAKSNAEMLRLVSDAPEYRGRPAVEEDLDFMASDPDLKLILDLLSDFGAGGRYFELDTILDPDQTEDAQSPSQTWSELEVHFWDSVSNGDDILEVSPAEVHERIGNAIASVVERYVRAVARMWFLHALGPESASFAVGSLDSWNRLPDEELGLPRGD